MKTIKEKFLSKKNELLACILLYYYSVNSTMQVRIEKYF